MRRKLPSDLIARTGMAALAAGIAVVVALASVAVYRQAATGPAGVDFLALYAGGALARSDPGAIYDLERVRVIEEAAIEPAVLSEVVLPFAYPPFVAAALAPLDGLAFRDAYRVGTLANLVGVLAVALVLRRRLVRATGAWRWFVLLAVSALPPWLTLIQGQTSILALWLMSLVVLDVRDERPGRAGLWLGLLTFKPQLVPIIALALLVRRQWRSLASAVAVAVALWVPALAWVGTTGVKQFVDVTARMAAASGALGVHPDRMFNLRALWLATPITASMPPWTWWVAAAAVALAATWLHRRAAPGQAPLAWIATVLATLLVAPHLNLHDLTLLLLPVALLLGEWTPREAGELPATTANVPLATVAAALALAELPLAGAVAATVGAGPTAVVPALLLVAFACAARASRRGAPAT